MSEYVRGWCKRNNTAKNTARCGRPSRGALIRFMGSWESNVERLIMCFRPVTVRGFGNCFCCRNCIVSTANSMNSYETHWTSFPWTTTVSTHHLHRRHCSPCPHLRKGSIICDVGCFSHCFDLFFSIGHISRDLFYFAGGTGVLFGPGCLDDVIASEAFGIMAPLVD
ncbi:hypothetical protein BJV77DRAFT_1018356 [Russula vinacea]|nr:hypothetical protein BJV77DRAFT_1018356 [Russula vinacea]